MKLVGINDEDIDRKKLLFMGSCVLGPEKLVVTCGTHPGQYFYGETITFIRQPQEDEITE